MTLKAFDFGKIGRASCRARETSIGTGVDRKDGGAVEELYLGAGGGPAGGGYLGAIRGTKRGRKVWF